MSLAAAKILPDDLVIMDQISRVEPLRIDLVYARADHPENIFKTTLYRADAPCVLHKKLAEIVIRAARQAQAEHGWILAIKDALRPVEAQAAMVNTPIVQAHPEWTDDETRLISRPGRGGHPRGMAVDLMPYFDDGTPVDLGVQFDDMPATGQPNRSHRDYADLPADVRRNRDLFKELMIGATVDPDFPLWPLPDEVWHYQFPAAVLLRYEPVHDADLPPALKMLAG